VKKYKYVGDGAGVPGLPHEISQAEIDQFNELQAAGWSAALSSGLYVEVAEPKPVTRSKKSAVHPAEGE